MLTLGHVVDILMGQKSCIRPMLSATLVELYHGKLRYQRSVVRGFTFHKSCKFDDIWLRMLGAKVECSSLKNMTFIYDNLSSLFFESLA